MPITKLLYSFIENGPLTGSLFGTASYALDSVYSASLASRSNILESASSSFSTRVTNLVTDSGSFSSRAATLEIASGSFSTRITNLVSDSGSFSTRITNLVTDSSSFSTRTATLETASGSFSIRVTNLVSDSSSFSARLSSYTGSIFGTASYATKAETLVSGININAGLITASAISVTTLNVVTITSSIEYASGSSVFGTKTTDTQKFTGSVSITGSLTVNGTVTATGTIGLATNNTAFQVKDTGGTLRTAFLMNASDVFTIGTTNNVVRINSYDLELNAQTGRTVAAMVNGSTIGSFSSTGLAVTGTGTFTTAPNSGIDIYSNPSTNSAKQTTLRLWGHEAIAGRYVEVACVNGSGANINNLALSTGYAGTVTERLRIDAATGNVGIGTASPETTLDVQAANASFRVYGTGASDTPQIQLRNGSQIWQQIVDGADSHKWKLRTGGGTTVLNCDPSAFGLAVTGALSATGILSGPGFRASKTTATSGLVKIQDEGANVYNVIGSRNNADSAALPLNFQATNFAFNGAVDITGGLVVGVAGTGTGITIKEYSAGTQRNWGIRDDVGVDRLRFSRGASDQVFWDVLKVAASDQTGNQFWYTNGAQRMELSSTGLAVTGAITATGNITAYFSDDRLKTKLGKIENALDKICSLEGFYYEANDLAQSLGYKAVREVGISAQSVQSVLPEIVAPAPIDSKYLTIHYERTVPLIIEAIKELRNEIAALKK